MIFLYLFLGFILFFVLLRLVQWVVMVEQLKQEGRDIRKEMDRIAEMKWKEVIDGS